MASAKPFNRKQKAAIAVALSWGAGLIDVLGYLTLYHAFVANMTGNTVTSVLHGVQGHWSETFHRGVPIAAFFVGLMPGEVTLESAKRAKRHRIAARAFAMEAICLGAFLTLSMLRFGPTMRVRPSAAMFVLLVSLIAIAMGVQSASLRKIGALTIFTTFVTGTLTKLANDITVYCFWLRDVTRGRTRQRLGAALRLSPRQESFQSMVLLTVLYLAYAAGALVGAEGFYRWGLAMAAAPLGFVLCAMAIDIVRPISPVP